MTRYGKFNLNTLWKRNNKKLIFLLFSVKFDNETKTDEIVNIEHKNKKQKTENQQDSKIETENHESSNDAVKWLVTNQPYDKAIKYDIFFR